MLCYSLFSKLNVLHDLGRFGGYPGSPDAWARPASRERSGPGSEHGRTTLRHMQCAPCSLLVAITSLLGAMLILLILPFPRLGDAVWGHLPNNMEYPPPPPKTIIPVCNLTHNVHDFCSNTAGCLSKHGILPRPFRYKYMSVSSVRTLNEDRALWAAIIFSILIQAALLSIVSLQVCNISADLYCAVRTVALKISCEHLKWWATKSTSSIQRTNCVCYARQRERMERVSSFSYVLCGFLIRVVNAVLLTIPVVCLYWHPWPCGLSRSIVEFVWTCITDLFSWFLPAMTLPNFTSNSLAWYIAWF